MSRWLRRIGLAVAALAAAVTVAAIGYDFATSGDSRPAGALYHGRFARIRGTLVAYRRWGTSGAPILLLGGAAEPAWVWHEVGPLLASRGHVVYAIDLPPFGYSERRGPYTMRAWIGLVEGFERGLGLVRPLIVGHSLGAGVAAATALDDPAGVSGIVLLDGDALPFGSGHRWLTHLLVYPWYPALFRLLTSSDWLVGRVLANAWGKDPPRFSHATLAQFERPFRVAGTADAIVQLARGGIPGVTIAVLKRLRVPRTVVWGADDGVDSLESGRATAAALGVRIVVLPRAGHLSMLANAGATAGAIERADAAARRG